MNAVKALQQWCRVQCQGYRDVAITNMTTSFRDGLAFCALIHKERPELIDFDSLRKENVYENNQLAFSVAENELGIPALLDANDMVALRIPDRLSILTYVSQYYNYFHGRSPIGGLGGIKRPAEGPTEEPSGKKNQPVVSRVFPSSKPARENSPPSLSNNQRPLPSPKQARNSKQDVLVEKSNQMGTLSNKCASCNQHVHLVQRHLVEGKLYHRSCAKSLAAAGKPAAPRDLPTNTPVSKVTFPPESAKTTTNTPSHTPARPGPAWLREKPSTAASFSSAAKDSRTTPVSKPTASNTTSETTFTTTISSNTRPTPAPRTSTTAAKTLQSKLLFHHKDNAASEDEKKAATSNRDNSKGQNVSGTVQQANDGGFGKKEANVSLNTGEKKTKAAVGGESGKTSKSQALAFISKKLSEENNSKNSKTTLVTVGLKKSDKPLPAETPKKETEGVRGRVRLRADPSLLDDLFTPNIVNSAQNPAAKSGLRSRTPERGGTSANTSAASENECPAEWRSKLKPIQSKDTKPAGPIHSTPKPWADMPSFSVTPPGPKGLVNGHEHPPADGPKSESNSSKTKADYIPKEDIVKELQEIEENLNELEKMGIELEKKLRSCEEDGEDDSLMVDWFSLIRKKQLAMRRESELVYIGRTQDLEEEQPSVEQELRRLMEKPDHLKTPMQRKREEQLMAKLMEIVNDRNSIIEGLDEDRLREEEEDEELNKMMKDLNIKKEKPKKKSPMSKLFSWGNKKEG